MGVVFRGYYPENSPTQFNHTKGTSLHQSTHFEPSTVKIGSGVQAVGDGKNKKGEERKGKERKEKGRTRYYKNAQKRYISHPCSKGPNDAIFTTFGTVVDLTYVMTYARFCCYRLNGGHSAAVQNLPVSMTSMVGLTTGKHYLRAAVITIVIFFLMCVVL